MSKNLQLIIAGFITSLSAFAQSDTSSKTLDPVILTANKLPQKQRTTGKVITLISKEEIEKSAGKSLAQLLNEQAGITINGALNNAGTNQSLYMRGASSGRTLILLDGIPIYDPSVINNEFDLNLISLNNVECIEVCRGAQSTIYGSDAVAGVVNIITSKPNANKPINLKISSSAGNYGTYRGSIDLAGKKDKLSYTAKYSKFHTNGFSSAYDSSKNKSFDHDAFNSDILNTGIKYQFTPALAIKSFVQYSYSKTELDAAAFSDEKDYGYTSKVIIAGTGILYSKNKVSFAANYQYSRNKRLYTNDSLDVPGFSKFSTDRYHAKAHYLEAFSKIDLGSGFSVLQGADYRFSSMNNQYFSLSSFGPYKSEFKDTSHSQASIYASVFYNGLNEKLNVDLGERINVHSQYGTNSTFTFNPSYSFNEHYRILGSIASAFKAPTLYQLYSAYGNRSLKPEKSKTYELGFEQQHVKIKNRIVYFRREIENGLDFNYISFKYFNINRQAVKGIELESKIQPVKQFTISLNYTYLNPEEHSQSRVSFKDTSYQYLLRRPKHNLNLNAGYSFDNGLYISAGAKYVSKRQDIGGYKKADVLLDDYVLLNAYTEYKFKKMVKLFADFQNITGKQFFDVRGYNSIPFLFNTGVSFSL
jgi:vitamin B12 transporter